MWIVNDKKTWHIGYIIDLDKDDDGMCSVDHLECVQKENNELWHFPKKEDACKVDLGQIIGIKLEYKWDIQNMRNQKMKVKNHRAIYAAVKQKQFT